MTYKRISSTPLGAYIDCPRKFWYEHGAVRPHPVQANPPMAVGTCFHALVEFYQTHNNRWPSHREFEQMKGNYDDPIEAVNRFGKSVLDQAWEMAFYMEEHRPDLLELPEGASVEFNVETLGIEFYPGGPVAGGYLDVFIPEQRLIRDWKCRGGFHYVPRTPDDFMKNVQLCYYAAIMAFHFGWDSVTVEHVNILRPDRGGPEILPIQYELPAFYLQGVWAHLVETVVPEMVAAHAEPDELEIERNIIACFKYGKCSHYTYCHPANNESNEWADALALLGGN